MSNHVTSLLRRRTLGIDFTCKSIVLLMGDLASDDGSGIYASKETMARELETSQRTIQRSIKKLVKAGFVSEVGKRKHQNGYTCEYKINVDLVENLPDNRNTPPTQCRPSTQDVEQAQQHVGGDGVSPVTVCHQTPDSVSPHGVTVCHPNQRKPKEPNACALAREAVPPSPPADSGRSGRPMPTDLAEQIRELTAKAKGQGKGIERRK